MLLLAQILVALVALLHVYILVLEMFLWTKPQGLRTFRNTPAKAETTRVLGACSPRNGTWWCSSCRV